MATSTDYKVTITQKLDLVPGTSNEVQIEWKFTKDTQHLDHFRVVWYEYIDKTIGKTDWVKTGEAETVSKGAGYKNEYYATHSAQGNAKGVAVAITPIAKYKDSKKKIRYWEGKSVGGTGTSSTRYYFSHNPIDAPPVPEITADQLGGKNRLVVTINDFKDSTCDAIEFYVAVVDKDGDLHKSTLAKKEVVPYDVNTALRNVSYVYDTVQGAVTYVARCRARNKKTGTFGPYSSFSSPVTTAPSITIDLAAPTLTSLTSHSVRVSWDKPDSELLNRFEIGYVTNLNDWNTDRETRVNVTDATHYDLDVGDSGNTYYFRYRRINDSGSGAWSKTASITLGLTPVAPTTWESDSVISRGNVVNLYWIHNSRDNSKQRAFQIKMTMNGEDLPIISGSTPGGQSDPYDPEKSYNYELDTSDPQFEDGELTWCVRTMGVTMEYSEWSTVRKIRMYQQPSIDVRLMDGESAIYEIESLPLNLSVTHSPNTQTQVTTSVIITNNVPYETTNRYGDIVDIETNTVIFSRFYDKNGDLSEEISGADITLASGVEYTISVVSAFDSGLKASGECVFTTHFDEQQHVPNGNIYLDREFYTATINAWCLDDETQEPLENILLSVYRMNNDGSFTPLLRDMENTSSIFVLDPHPPLDVARYRITATDTTDGTVQYQDIPILVDEKLAVITWDEEYTTIEDGEVTTQPVWIGSMLRLQYNVDIQDTSTIDSSMVEYIGRSHPVSYYGTQLGFTSSWSAEIPKYDTETLDLLRRLQTYLGDVYVRDPYGSGYQAKIDISYNIRHKEVTIPITITVTKTDDGSEGRIQSSVITQYLDLTDNITGVDFHVDDSGNLIMDKGDEYRGGDYLITGDGEIGVEA